MRRISIDQASPGDELAAPIKVHSPHPQVIYKLKIEAGEALTKKHLDKLRNLGINQIPIKDPDTEDLDKYVYDQNVEEAEEEIRKAFEIFTSRFANNGSGPEAIRNLRDAIDKLIRALEGSTIMAAFTNLKTHDSYTAEHSLDVTKISLQLAIENEAEFRRELKAKSGANAQYIYRHMLEDLGLGAMLHDLGKMNIDQSILRKPGELTDTEYAQIKNHPEIGYRELDEVDQDLNAPAKVPAREHHEQYNGEGYPQGLKGDDIHLFGRITACADVYSALTSERPYREANKPPEALGITHKMQKDGPHFDPDVYEKFLKIVLPYPPGLDVAVTNNRRGVVSEADPDDPYNPTVRILYENDQRLDSPYEVQIDEEVQIVEPTPKTGLVRL